MKHYRLLGTFFLLTTLLFGWENPVLAAPQKLRSLVEQQRYTEAYILANSVYKTQAGDPDFDYLLGIAALHCNHPQQAIFAFERVLTVQPNNAQAKAGLAQANAMLDRGNGTTQPFSSKMKKHFYIGAAAGYDSNVNSSTDEDFISTPTATSVPLLEDETRQSDSFTTLLGGAGFSKPLTENTAVFGQLAAGYHRNIHEHDFDYGIYQAATGFSAKNGAYLYRFPIQVQAINTGDQSFRRDAAIAAEIARPLDANNLVGGLFEFRYLQYPNEDLKDNYLLIPSAKWLHQFTAIPSQLETRIYYADGIAKDSAGDYLVKDFYGIQLIGKYTGIPQHTPFISVNAQEQRFDGTDPTFVETREDTYIDTTIGWRWQLTQRLAVQPDYTKVWNNSNIPLYDYQRYVAQIGLLYRFDA